LPETVRASSPPRHIVARLSRGALIAAGATAAALVAPGCGDMAVALYGAAILDIDAETTDAHSGDSSLGDAARIDAEGDADALDAGTRDESPLDAESDGDGGD
jgi:hypothetical protein